MRLVFFSKDGLSLPLATRCEKEGSDVTFVCTKGVDNGVIRSVSTPTLGPDSVLIFDDPVYGRGADAYRSQGYATIGASLFGSNLELIPEYNQSVCKIADNYQLPENSYIEAWFNGTDWIVGSTSICVYDSHFMPGDLGVETGYESGTTCFLKRIRPEVFKRTLGKLTSVLRRVSYTGPIRYDGSLSTGFNTTNCHTLDMVPLPCSRILADTAKGLLKRVAPKYEYATVLRVSYPPYPFMNGNGNSNFVVGKGTSVAISREEALQKAEKLAGKEKQYRVDAGSRANMLIPRLLKEEINKRNEPGVDSRFFGNDCS